MATVTVLNHQEALRRAVWPGNRASRSVLLMNTVLLVHTTVYPNIKPVALCPGLPSPVFHRHGRMSRPPLIIFS